MDPKKYQFNTTKLGKELLNIRPSDARNRIMKTMLFAVFSNHKFTGLEDLEALIIYLQTTALSFLQLVSKASLLFPTRYFRQEMNPYHP